MLVMLCRGLQSTCPGKALGDTIMLEFIKRGTVHFLTGALDHLGCTMLSVS